MKKGSKIRACVALSIPVPVSRHGEHHVGAGRDVVVGAGVLVVELDVRGLDGQLAALRHGVARVDGEVHDDLLDLARVGLDVPEAARRRAIVSSMSSPSRRRSIFSMPGDDLVQVEHLRLEHLLAAEREELPRELRRAHRRPCRISSRSARSGSSGLRSPAIISA